MTADSGGSGATAELRAALSEFRRARDYADRADTDADAAASALSDRRDDLLAAIAERLLDV